MCPFPFPIIRLSLPLSTGPFASYAVHTSCAVICACMSKTRQEANRQRPDRCILCVSHILRPCCIACLYSPSRYLSVRPLCPHISPVFPAIIRENAPLPARILTSVKKYRSGFATKKKRRACACLRYLCWNLCASAVTCRQHQARTARPDRCPSAYPQQLACP